MDPNLFQLDWMRTLEAVTAIVVLAFIVERVAALLFESRFFVLNTRVPDTGSDEAMREHEGVIFARRILRARDDPAEVERICNRMSATNPLWPPRQRPELAVQDAEKYLALMARRHHRRRTLSRWPIKEALAFVLAAGVCLAVDFDAVAIIILSPQTTTWGAILTGAVIAGGSKAAIALFHDLLKVRSQALQDVRKPPADAKRGDHA